jgi:hypothetical protein
MYPHTMYATACTSNTRRNASRRVPRHHTIVQKNGTLDSRTLQPNISPPCSTDNVAMACIEQLENSTRGNHGAKQSNALILPFLGTYTLGGSLSIPVVVAHQGLEDFDVENPLVKRMKRLVRTSLAGTNTIELRHLSLEVEGEVRTSYGDEVLEEDE